MHAALRACRTPRCAATTINALDGVKDQLSHQASCPWTHVGDQVGDGGLIITPRAFGEWGCLGRSCLGCWQTVASIVLVIARLVVRGVMPYPDLLRRGRVRRRARILVTGELWPQDEADVTGLDYAHLALLRLLWLQRETRRAVRTRQREAAAQLARTCVETSILGLWCLQSPDAASTMRVSELKRAPAMLTFLSGAGLIPQDVIRQAVRALGEPQNLPDVRAMTSQIDARTGASLTIHLYDLAYRPASQYFTHASQTALLRHVSATRRRRVRPTNPWTRRTPVRLADACVGLLAAAIADRAGAPTELLVRYATDHAGRVLPPLLTTVGKGLLSRLSIADLRRTLDQARDVRTLLSRAQSPEARREAGAHLRELYNEAIARLNLDLPADAIQPVVNHLIATVLTKWDAEHAGSRTPAAATGSR